MKKRPRIIREPEQHGTNTGRDVHGRFVRGNRIAAGNKGRRGARALNLALDKKLTPRAWDSIVHRAVVEARHGDHNARVWLADRHAGRPRLEPDSRHLELDLPELRSAEDVAEATRLVVGALVSGELALEDGLAALRAVAEVRESVVLEDLEQRLRSIELSNER